MCAKRRDQQQQTKMWQASGTELIGQGKIQLSQTKSDQQTTGLSTRDDEDTRRASLLLLLQENGYYQDYIELIVASVDLQLILKVLIRVQFGLHIHLYSITAPVHV